MPKKIVRIGGAISFTNEDGVTLYDVKKNSLAENCKGTFKVNNDGSGKITLEIDVIANMKNLELFETSKEEDGPKNEVILEDEGICFEVNDKNEVVFTSRSFTLIAGEGLGAATLGIELNSIAGKVGRGVGEDKVGPRGTGFE